MKKYIVGAVSAMVLVCGIAIAEETAADWVFKGKVNLDKNCDFRINNTKVTATGAQLNSAATSVSSYMPNMVGEITGACTPSSIGGTNVVNFQVKDMVGANSANKTLIKVWFSTTSVGAPSTNNIAATAIVCATGTVINTTTANADYNIATDTNGIATLRFVGSLASTNYCMASAFGKIFPITCVVTNL